MQNFQAPAAAFHGGDDRIDRAERTVDERTFGDDLAAFVGDRSDGFAAGEAGGDDVFDHKNARAGLERESPAQVKDTFGPLQEQRVFIEDTRDFLPDDDAAHRRADDGVDLFHNFFGDIRDHGLSEPRGARGAHQHARALQVVSAMFARRKLEMPFE